MEFECDWCKGITKINVKKKGDKGTVPEIEYCPIGGMSDEMIKSAGEKDG